ncbi:MAG TPA: gliding motility-associated ABC transporter permease subunit GldF [Luteibaculaceae bacterium]|nr:gliding motility-associated ABC transporter permease subunit GldF [Luteibaculaceae bacterium]
MYALIKKEISGFLSSLVGYVVMFIFLTMLGLMLWVFPGDFNVIDSGYAQLDSLFTLAPWVFMFLIPAITMRMFAEEKRVGTLELLLTKPLSELQLIIAKYAAALVLVIVALLPTLVYYISVYQMGNPVGNIDSGGFWGSFLGLIFLSSAFVTIGLLASSISDNQVVSFIIAVFLSFIVFTGFDALSSLSFLSNYDSFIQNLGINFHYASLSRGVVDTRDVIYFISASAFFILITRLVLESRKW